MVSRAKAVLHGASFVRMMCMDKEGQIRHANSGRVSLFAGITNCVVLCMCVPDLVFFCFSGECIATDRLLSGLES